LTTFYDEHMRTTAKTLDQADALRSQKRDFRGKLIEAGEGFEERFAALEAEVKQMQLGPVEKVKQLMTGKKKNGKTKEA
jgi:hypothetical protein